jgi:hypothetical protein
MNPLRITTGSPSRLGLRLSRVLAVVLCVGGFAAIPAVAQATSNPTAAQYHDSATQANEDVSGGGGSNTASGSGLQRDFVSGLPFTGLDLIALVAVAVALTSVGFALRWLTAHRHP